MFWKTKTQKRVEVIAGLFDQLVPLVAQLTVRLVLLERKVKDLEERTNPPKDGFDGL